MAGPGCPEGGNSLVPRAAVIGGGRSLAPPTAPHLVPDAKRRTSAWLPKGRGRVRYEVSGSRTRTALAQPVEGLRSVR
ncbi:hypothetical protein GCM10010497_59230 [Streptomyces cinereoruber]|uniref:Uncharacterized protein n=1 Tax=Streptomyces cinereoruber TaxID=67260 RepID=A0AAV4KT67_9ACTN|nr:hypothetical protein GCM10010497_59230 [Streptomyces cinereoruber]